MTRCTLSSALLLCLALSACRGSFEAGQPGTEDSGANVEPEEDAGANTGSSNGGEEDSGDGQDDRDAGGNPEQDASTPEDDGGVVEVPEGFALSVKFASNDQFDSYLTDENGRALYFYAGDAPGSAQTTCASTECSAEWPPFDWGKEYNAIVEAAKMLEPTPAGVKDFGRFHRVDGAWQVTYKNRPLYYFSGEQAQTVTGDGHDQVWFVARDYFVFLRTVPNVLPYGRDVQPQGTPYLTDGSGKSLYARLATATAGGVAPVVPCEGECLAMWPEWTPIGDLSKLALPSTLARTKFSSLFRDNGAAQIAYEGYPLHYNVGDEEPGETRGHEVNAWRLVAPSGF